MKFIIPSPSTRSFGMTIANLDAMAMRHEVRAPERRRPKRIAKKIRRRYGAQHYRDVYRCFNAQVKRELLALQRRAFNYRIEMLALYGDDRVDALPGFLTNTL